MDMDTNVELYKKKFNEAQQENGDWQDAYIHLMTSVYDVDVLFFALSRDDFNPETKMSEPLVSTKDFDGTPALYVFTDVNLASGWMSHYGHVTEDKKYGLIGAVHKEDHGFLSIFQIAHLMGVKVIMLDEGGSYVGISIKSFLTANDLDSGKIHIQISNEEAQRLRENNEQPEVQFPKIPVIPLTRD